MSLTLKQATTIVEVALRRGRETNCAPLAVAVLDSGGHLKTFGREDGAGILRPQIALGKAWGALGMGVGSRALAKRLADNPQQHPFFTALNAMSDGRVVPVPGGVLIRDAAGVLIGAVGISGDVSDKDEACAVAGIEAAGLKADTGGLTAMKVKSVRTFLVDPGAHKRWLFVKVETDTGLHGWGECYTQLDRDRAIESHVQELGRYLIGRSPFAIKHFTYVAYTDFATKRGSMDLYCAISGLEQALWDIAGKATSQPVHNLLGGAFRTRLRVYANGWASGRDPGTVAEQALAVMKKGFTALKFDPFPGPWRAYIDRRDEQLAVEQVSAVRDAVGPDVDILVEVHRRLAPANAIRVARMMEPYGPFWFEEPVSARDLGGLLEAKRAITLPVVTGEELYTKTEFHEVITRRAADILNPDVCNCGGILELREIAAMAEPHHIAISPHNYNSTTVGLAATLQAAAGMPNFLITEYFVNFEALGREIARPPFEVENSTISLPTTPGLGIDLDEDALARHPYRERPPRPLRHPNDE